MVPVVGKNVFPQMHIYRWTPLPVCPLRLNFPDAQNGHFAGMNEFIMSASPLSLTVRCR
jgi:hypothetical protein